MSRENKYGLFALQKAGILSFRLRINITHASVYVKEPEYMFRPRALYKKAIWICQCQQQSVALAFNLPNLIHGQMDRIDWQGQI